MFFYYLFMMIFLHMKHFCSYFCSELSSKLQDTLLMIEEQLDVALSKICNNFDTLHYEKLQKAYG